MPERRLRTTPKISERPSRRDPALDGLRGVAILLVFLFHYGGGLHAHNPLAKALGYVTQAGWIGVELFFVLSGFLITGLLFGTLGQPHALRNFYARRALRILPLYLTALLLCAVAALARGASIAQLRPILLYAGFLQNQPGLARLALHTPPPMPLFHLWSIAVEEQFYLLWPFLLWTAPNARRAAWLCAGCFLLSLLFRAGLLMPALATGQISQELLATLPARAGALAAGAFLSLLPAVSSRGRSSLPLIASGAVLLFVVTGYRAGSFLLTGGPSGFLLLGTIDVACVAVVALALTEGRLRGVLSLSGLGFLGRISYGLYVLHILLEPLFDRLGAALTHSSSGFSYQTARLLVAFPVTVLLAYLSFVFLERPFLRLKSRFPRQEIVPDPQAVRP